MEVIDARHFNELIAYDRIRHPDNWRMEYYFALLAALISNAHRGKNETARQLGDFLYDKPRKETVWTDEMMFDYFVALTKAMGGTVPDGYNRQT